MKNGEIRSQVVLPNRFMPTGATAPDGGELPVDRDISLRDLP
jgi:hypothetical protein